MITDTSAGNGRASSLPLTHPNRTPTPSPPLVVAAGGRGYWMTRNDQNGPPEKGRTGHAEGCAARPRLVRCRDRTDDDGRRQPADVARAARVRRLDGDGPAD